MDILNENDLKEIINQCDHVQHSDKPVSFKVASLSLEMAVRKLEMAIIEEDISSIELRKEGGNMREKILDALHSSGLNDYVEVNGCKSLFIYYKSLVSSMQLFFSTPQDIAEEIVLDRVHFLIIHSSLAEMCRRHGLFIDGYDLELRDEITKIIREDCWGKPY